MYVCICTYTKCLDERRPNFCVLRYLMIIQYIICIMMWKRVRQEYLRYLVFQVSWKNNFIFSFMSAEMVQKWKKNSRRSCSWCVHMCYWIWVKRFQSTCVFNYVHICEFHSWYCNVFWSLLLDRYHLFAIKVEFRCSFHYFSPYR